MNPSVTVAIPTFNSEKFISDAIYSILNQSHSPKEILISDDCSSDDTTEIVQNLKKQDNRIKLFINSTNLGYQCNWNKCLEYATSDFVLLLHADDLLKPGTIKKQIQFFHKHPEVALIGGYEDTINENGNLIRKASLKKTKIYLSGQIYEFVTETGSYISCSSVMFNMEKIKTVGYFDTDTIATDELFWPKILMYYPIAILDESLIYRRIHANQTEYKDFVKYYPEALDIYKKFHRIIDYEKRENYKKHLKSFLKNKFAVGYVSFIGPKCAKMGFVKPAMGYVFYSLRIKPLLPFENLTFWKGIIKTIVFTLNLKKTKN